MGFDEGYPRRPLRRALRTTPVKRGLSQTPPLPTSAVAAWHSEIACSPTAWVDYIGARSIPGFNSPIVAPDPGFFNGRNVAHTNAALAKNWFGIGVGTILSPTDFPWVFCVGRYVSDTSIGVGIMAGCADASNQTLEGAFRFAGGSPQCCFFNNQQCNNATPADRLPHRHKGWRDGTLGHYVVDSAETTITLPGAVTRTITGIGIGVYDTGGAGNARADVRIPYFLICTAKPTAAEEAAVDAWAQAYWGVP